MEICFRQWYASQLSPTVKYVVSRNGILIVPKGIAGMDSVFPSTLNNDIQTSVPPYCDIYRYRLSEDALSKMLRDSHP